MNSVDKTPAQDDTEWEAVFGGVGILGAASLMCIALSINFFVQGGWYLMLSLIFGAIGFGVVWGFLCYARDAILKKG